MLRATSGLGVGVCGWARGRLLFSESSPPPGSLLRILGLPHGQSQKIQAGPGNLHFHVSAEALPRPL